MRDLSQTMKQVLDRRGLRGVPQVLGDLDALADAVDDLGQPAAARRVRAARAALHGRFLDLLAG